MPLDEATRSLAIALQREVKELAVRERMRADRGEGVRYDSVSRMAMWESKKGEVLGRWYGEIVATYVPADRILRWGWAGRSRGSVRHDDCAGRRDGAMGASHAEAIFREGAARGVPQLGMSVVGDLDEEDALTLARLGVLAIHGQGVLLQRRESSAGGPGSWMEIVGLFDSSHPREAAQVDPTRYSVPPPPVVSKSISEPPGRSTIRSQPAPPGIGGVLPALPRIPAIPSISNAAQNPFVGLTPPLPPIREIYDPRNAPRTPSSPLGEAISRRVRQPAKAVFVPVGVAVLEVLARTAPKFQQALLVMNVHADEEVADKRRLVVMVAVVDASGSLRAIEPSKELLDASVRMVDVDAAEGNGPWRKLSARILPKDDGGATLHVDVV